MANNREVLLDVRLVTKKFGKNSVLKKVSLTMNHNDVMVICGPSGSGKSTLLHCINGLEQIDDGTIYFDGHVLDKKNIRENRKKIGMIFQHFELFPHLTAMENVTLAPVKILKREEKEVFEYAHELFRSVGLNDRENYYPYQLSGGQKQRVAIIRALAMKPKLIMFDEPTSALDPEMIKEVLDVMKKLAANGMTMLVVTHEMGFAREVSSSISFFEDGTIVETKPRAEFFSGNVSERTKKFLDQILEI
jgi:ABC-type polar amino acid transport system ATPase subunit